MLKQINLLMADLNQQHDLVYDPLMCEAIIELIENGNFELAFELNDLPQTNLKSPI